MRIPLFKRFNTGNGLSVRNVRIQTRLMLSFILISLVPLALCGYISFKNSSNAIESKISSYSQNT